MRPIWTVVFLAIALGASATARADAEAGKTTYAARGCIGCHGAGGVSTVTTYPSLKGRGAAFIRKNLTDYRSGALKNPVMNAMAAGLSDEEIRNLGDYIATLK